jgi:hypothetical protein
VAGRSLPIWQGVPGITPAAHRRDIVSLFDALAETISAESTSPKPQSFQAGSTYVGFVATLEKDVIPVVPTRSWPDADERTVILTQGQAKGLFVFAKRQQALVSVGKANEELGHLLDRPFTVKATPAVLQFVKLNSHFGGKTQVAFFKATREADNKVRKARNRAFNKALKARMEEIS